MIRQLTPADLEGVAPLFAAYLEFYGVEQPPEQQRTFLAGRLAGNDSVAFGVFEESGHMTGFALIHLTYNSLRLAPAWILHDLFVVPEERRQGAARQLLEAVHQAAGSAGACEVALSTAHDNTPARNLYESAGYRQDKVFRSYVFNLR